MTISSTASSVVARSDGGTHFDYEFLIPAGYARVTLIDPAGVQTVLPASSYAISGEDDPGGGDVTYPLAGPALAPGYSIVIQRVIPFTQPTKLSNQGGFYPEVVEAALDWLEMQIQQGFAVVNTGIHYPAVDVNPVSELAPAAARAGKFFGFDGNGNPAMLNGNLLAGDLLPYTLAGAAFSNIYKASINSVAINAGWYIEFNTALASIVQGLSVHIERTSGTLPNAVVGGMFSIQNQTSPILGGLTASVFGVVTEAFNQPGGNGGVVGAEFAAGNMTNNCTQPKLGVNIVWKDRADGVATVTQGLGANEYNLGAMALFLSSQTRSTAGEFCGWRRGVLFDEYSMDFDANGAGIGIDFAKVHYYGGSDPLTAYRMTAAIRMRDFQSILWNGDPTLPNDPTEPLLNAVRTFFNSTTGRWTLSTSGVEKWGVDVSTGDMYKAGVLITPVSTASNNVWTGTNTFQNTFTLQTDLIISGAHNFKADFTNATLTNRANFQTSTVNSATDICAIPNGTGVSASWNLFNNSAMANCGFGHIGISGGEFSFQSSQVGAGVAVPMTFYCGAAGSAERMRLSTAGNLNINTTVDSAAGAKLRVNGMVQIDDACAFRADLNGGATVPIPTGVFTAVIMTTKRFDQHGAYSTGTGRFIPPAGKYLLMANGNNVGGTDQRRWGVYIFKNGAALAGSYNVGSGGLEPHGSCVSIVDDANGTDYYEFYIWQDTGVATNLSSNAWDTYFGGFRIG